MKTAVPLHTLITICCTITLTACGQKPSNKPTANSDIRRLSAVSTLGGAGDVQLMAIRACDKENKKLEIISTSSQNGILGGEYPVILFRCK